MRPQRMPTYSPYYREQRHKAKATPGATDHVVGNAIDSGEVDNVPDDVEARKRWRHLWQPVLA